MMLGNQKLQKKKMEKQYIIIMQKNQRKSQLEFCNKWDIQKTKFLDLCRADVQAQSEVIEEKGEIKDTRKNRLDRYNKIEQILPEARVYKQIKETENQISKKQKELEKYTKPPKPIVKKGIPVNQKQLDMWKEWESKPQGEKEEVIRKVQEEIDIAIKKKNEILESITEEKQQ